ncbi:hypothetical protein CC80DRAFT_495650 [Byssothecium circinans]|uniref:Uncharacterized protein n=1 Tax=Byssothecium circinans TaxID=147558 RepID=A0A6A5TI23_9PLEO|nr:hypothetical protein CC80DRAFT_495650 [Byssothecium circinans]
MLEVFYVIICAALCERVVNCALQRSTHPAQFYHELQDPRPVKNRRVQSSEKF